MKINIIGAGLAGATAAYILKNKGHKVEVFEQKNHVGGTCFDSYINNILVHNYGAHIFNTNSKRAWDFVNQFAEFYPHKHKVYACTDKGVKLIPIPVPTSYTDWSEKDIIKYIFKPYSEKQWGIPYNEIPKLITSRVPKKCDQETYHNKKYEGIPIGSYTKMIEKMLNGTEIHLNVDSKDNHFLLPKYMFSSLNIYTGKIDEWFGYRYGELKYRSLTFDHKQLHKMNVCGINHCCVNPADKKLYTKVRDNSYWYDINTEYSIITYEYPCEYTKGYNEPYYPFPDKKNIALAKKYKQLAAKESNTIFLGRLGTYKYMNMDETILQVMDRLKNV